MNDVGTVVRKAFYQALNGNISIEGSPIPIVDEKLDLQITEHTLYMLIGAQNETPGNVKSYWAKEVDLMISVVNRRAATNTKTLIESIANQMLTILFPTRISFGVTLDAPFKLSYVRLINSDYTFDKIDSGFNILKQMTFKTRLIHS